MRDRPIRGSSPPLVRSKFLKALENVDCRNSIPLGLTTPWSAALGLTYECNTAMRSAGESHPSHFTPTRSTRAVYTEH